MQFFRTADVRCEPRFSLERAHDGRQFTRAYRWSDGIDGNALVPGPEPPQSANALLEPRHGPWKVEVHNDTGAPKAQSFAQHVGGNEQVEWHRAGRAKRFHGV